ncbi:MAG: outer membrane protein assembly factor BamB [Burkholderiaceae bacterium]|jgi:outer membrane assembly lipoprotein YfgL|nr:MAG: outer membrane protein assembly factor BamB [Burkholderiaceae bacterium]
MLNPVVTRLARWTLPLCCAMLLAACAVGEKRPNPQPLPPNVDLIGVRPAWNTRLSAIGFPLQVQVVNNRVVVATNDGTVVTLDAASGREVARASAGAPLAAGVGSDGLVAAVVTQKNQLVVLEGGQVLWKHTLPTESYTAPLVAGARVFVLGADRSLSAFDERTGAPLWHTAAKTGDMLVLQESGVLIPVGNVLVAGMSGRMIGVNPNTGSVLWEAPVGTPRGANDVERLAELVAGVARQGQTVCARSFQTAVGCVDTATGRVLWTHKANGTTGVAGDGQHVFGGEWDDRVLAWNATTGEEVWSSDLLKWRNLTGPLVLGRSVVFGDSGGLVHLLSRADGRPLDRLTTDGSGIAATPVLAGNTLVVVTRAGGVYGFVPG